MPQGNDNAVTIFNIITPDKSLNECDFIKKKSLIEGCNDCLFAKNYSIILIINLFNTYCYPKKQNTYSYIIS